MAAAIPAGSQVKILRGANADRTGTVQPGTWPNSYGNYGINIAEANGTTIGYWIAANDVELAAAKPAVVEAAPAAAVPDWIQVKDNKSGRMYWHNKKTRQSSWSRPAGV